MNSHGSGTNLEILSKELDKNTITQLNKLISDSEDEETFFLESLKDMLTHRGKLSRPFDLTNTPENLIKTRQKQIDDTYNELMKIIKSNKALAPIKWEYEKNIMKKMQSSLLNLTVMKQFDEQLERFLDQINWGEDKKQEFKAELKKGFLFQVVTKHATSSLGTVLSNPKLSEYKKAKLKDEFLRESFFLSGVSKTLYSQNPEASVTKELLSNEKFPFCKISSNYQDVVKLCAKGALDTEFSRLLNDDVSTMIKNNDFKLMISSDKQRVLQILKDDLILYASSIDDINIKKRTITEVNKVMDNVSKELKIKLKKSEYKPASSQQFFGMSAQKSEATALQSQAGRERSKVVTERPDNLNALLESFEEEKSSFKPK